MDPPHPRSDRPHIEYRPLPTQPTVDDFAGLQALVVGLVHGIVTTDHPLQRLPWTDARDGMYAAAEDGLDATLPSRDHDGERSTDQHVIYRELFHLARHRRHDRDLHPDCVDELLEPIEAHWHQRTIPTAWKRQRARDRLHDGATLTDAIVDTQHEYVKNATTHDTFADWFDAHDPTGTLRLDPTQSGRQATITSLAPVPAPRTPCSASTSQTPCCERT